MKSKVVKYNTYRLIDTNSFELPLPFRFEILKKDFPVAEYEILDEDNVVCNIITRHKEDMITPIARPLSLSDIHYLFSCRVFQNFTPYTAHMLRCVGLEKYNVFDIITRTHGIIPYDNYWLRFNGESLSYEQASSAFDSMMAEPIVAAVQPVSSQHVGGPDVSEILSQHTIDVSGIVARDGMDISQGEAENMLRTAVAYTPTEEDEVVNNKMSEDEIEALLIKAGIASAPAMAELSAPPVEEPSSGGMMSQDDIAALFAANVAPDPEPAPAEDVSMSGGKMSQDAIEALLNSMQEEANK